MIKLIIFDVYGVNLRGGYPPTCKFLAKKFGGDWKQIFKIIYTKYFNMAAERKITQQAAWQKGIEEARLPLTVAQIKKIHYSFMKLNKPVLEVARQLKNKYIIVLLCKNTRSQFYDIKKMFPELPETYGKNVINTWESGLPKASFATIKRICVRFRVKPMEIVYVDDQSENLHSAAELGAATILYKNFSKFKSELRNALR